VGVSPRPCCLQHGTLFPHSKLTRQLHCCTSTSPLPHSEENRKELVDNDGVDTVLTAMRMFTWNENVQVKACWLLASLASQYGAWCCPCVGLPVAEVPEAGVWEGLASPASSPHSFFAPNHPPPPPCTTRTRAFHCSECRLWVSAWWAGWNCVGLPQHWELLVVSFFFVLVCFCVGGSWGGQVGHTHFGVGAPTPASVSKLAPCM
jgi:hypothetical protein